MKEENITFDGVTCPACGKVFGSRRSLIAHKSRKHRNEELKEISSIVNRKLQQHLEKNGTDKINLLDLLSTDEFRRVKSSVSGSGDNDKKSRLQELENEVEGINTLMASLEDAHREGSILDRNYKEIKRKNMEKLAELKKAISSMNGGNEAGIPQNRETKEHPVLEKEGTVPESESRENTENDEPAKETTETMDAAEKKNMKTSVDDSNDSGHETEKEPEPENQEKEHADKEEAEEKDASKEGDIREKTSDNIDAVKNSGEIQEKKSKDNIDEMAGELKALSHPDNAAVNNENKEQKENPENIENEKEVKNMGDEESLGAIMEQEFAKDIEDEDKKKTKGKVKTGEKKEEATEPSKSGDAQEKEPVKPAETSVEPKSGTSNVNLEIKLDTEVNRINMELEKLKTLSDMVKDTRSSTDEKIQRLSEGMGEIRSLVYQREASMKEQEVKFEKVESMVLDIEPQKVVNQLRKQSNEMNLLDGRVEKLEKAIAELIEDVKKVETLLDKVGNLENVVNVSRDIEKKKEKIDKRLKEMESIASKVEKLYVTLSKSMENLSDYRIQQDNQQEKISDILKSLEEMNEKLFDYAKRDEIEDLKTMVGTVSKDINAVKEMANQPAAPADSRLAGLIEGLEEQKDSLEILLSSLEDEYKKGKIAEEDYKKSKEDTQEKIRDLDKRIVNLERGEPVSFEPEEKGEKSKEHDTKEKPEKKNKEEKETLKKAAKKDKASDEPKKEKLNSSEKKEKKSTGDLPELLDELSGEETDAKDTGTERDEQNPKTQSSSTAIAELESLLKDGLISRETYERTKEKLSKKRAD